MTRILLLFALFIALIFTACTPARTIQYVRGDLNSTNLKNIGYQDPVVQIGDVLSIIVFSANAEASALYNQPITISQAGTNTTPGYLVDRNGAIQFPGIGHLLVKGLTRDEVGRQLEAKLANLLTNPVCQVRFSNFKVTLLGEVNKPSVYSMPTEKISVLEAIGLAGDMTPFARRDSVLIVREINNERRFGWLDLTKSNVFESEFFYLKQNDLIVINANKNKAAINDQVTTRNIALATSVLSTIAIYLSIFKR